MTTGSDRAPHRDRWRAARLLGSRVHARRDRGRRAPGLHRWRLGHPRRAPAGVPQGRRASSRTTGSSTSAVARSVPVGTSSTTSTRPLLRRRRQPQPRSRRATTSSSATSSATACRRRTCGPTTGSTSTSGCRSTSPSRSRCSPTSRSTTCGCACTAWRPRCARVASSTRPFFVRPASTPVDTIIPSKRGKPFFNEKNVFWHYSEDLRWASEVGPWRYTFVGDWGHPANQKMAKFVRVVPEPGTPPLTRADRQGRQVGLPWPALDGAAPRPDQVAPQGERGSPRGWTGPHLRESANHVRDPAPAPRPRPAHLRGATARQAAAPPRRPHARRASRGRGRPGPPGLPRGPALDPLLRAAGRPSRGHDRPAQGRARRPRRRPAADPAHPGAQPHRRPWRHGQAGLAAVRRRPGRVGAHALPEPGHRLHLQPGRLRDELPVLRHRPGGAHPQHVDRRDRRAGRVRRPAPSPRRAPGDRWRGRGCRPGRRGRRVRGRRVGADPGQQRGSSNRRCTSWRSASSRSRSRWARAACSWACSTRWRASCRAEPASATACSAFATLR